MADLDAFEQFFRDRYRPTVRLGIWMGLTTTVAEDLAQETLARIHQRWEHVGDYDNPSAFARRVMVNLVLTERERSANEQHTRRRVIGETMVFDRTDRTPWIDHDDPVWAAVAALPTNQRIAIGLRYLDDLEIDEIASVIGCAPATVRVHLHRGHRALEQRLGADQEARCE